jgi:hypothetical protein
VYREAAERGCLDRLAAAITAAVREAHNNDNERELAGALLIEGDLQIYQRYQRMSLH